MPCQHIESFCCWAEIALRLLKDVLHFRCQHFVVVNLQIVWVHPMCAGPWHWLTVLYNGRGHAEVSWSNQGLTLQIDLARSHICCSSCAHLCTLQDLAISIPIGHVAVCYFSVYHMHINPLATRHQYQITTGQLMLMYYIGLWDSITMTFSLMRAYTLS